MKRKIGKICNYTLLAVGILIVILIFLIFGYTTSWWLSAVIFGILALLWLGAFLSGDL